MYTLYFHNILLINQPIITYKYLTYLNTLIIVLLITLCMRIHVENNNYHHLNNICIHCLQVNIVFENTETCSI